MFDRATGVHQALLDGSVLTARRTAAASALGAKHLASKEARNLLILGAGKVAAQLPKAFRTVSPIKTVRVWNVTPDSAERLSEDLRPIGWGAAGLRLDRPPEVHSAEPPSGSPLEAYFATISSSPQH